MRNLKILLSVSILLLTLSCKKETQVSSPEATVQKTLEGYGVKGKDAVPSKNLRTTSVGYYSMCSELYTVNAYDTKFFTDFDGLVSFPYWWRLLDPAYPGTAAGLPVISMYEGGTHYWATESTAYPYDVHMWNILAPATSNQTIRVRDNNMIADPTPPTGTTGFVKIKFYTGDSTRVGERLKLTFGGAYSGTVLLGANPMGARWITVPTGSYGVTQFELGDKYYGPNDYFYINIPNPQSPQDYYVDVAAFF